MIAPRWRTLRATSATLANRRDSAEIVKRLRERNIPVHSEESRTTKGTRCVRVWVTDTHYELAKKLVRDLIPSAFMTK